MIDPALLAKIAKLPPEAQAQALARIAHTSRWAGELVAVEVDQDASDLHVTLRFEYGAWEFWTPAQLDD